LLSLLDPREEQPLPERPVRAAGHARRRIACRRPALGGRGRLLAGVWRRPRHSRLRRPPHPARRAHRHRAAGARAAPAGGVLREGGVAHAVSGGLAALPGLVAKRWHGNTAACSPSTASTCANAISATGRALQLAGQGPPARVLSGLARRGDISPARTWSPPAIATTPLGGTRRAPARTYPHRLQRRRPWPAPSAGRPRAGAAHPHLGRPVDPIKDLETLTARSPSSGTTSRGPGCGCSGAPRAAARPTASGARALATGLGVADAVVFEGRVPDIRDAYARAVW